MTTVQYSRDSERATVPDDDGAVVRADEGGAVTQQHAVDYWTGADAEGFPDVVERRKARIVAIYRTPLWQRKED